MLYYYRRLRRWYSTAHWLISLAVTQSTVDSFVIVSGYEHRWGLSFPHHTGMIRCPRQPRFADPTDRGNTRFSLRFFPCMTSLGFCASLTWLSVLNFLIGTSINHWCHHFSDLIRYQILPLSAVDGDSLKKMEVRFRTGKLFCSDCFIGQYEDLARFPIRFLSTTAKFGTKSKEKHQIYPSSWISIVILNWPKPWITNDLFSFKPKIH